MDKIVSFFEGLGTETWLYIIFGAIILTFLLVDLGLFQKKAKAISFKSAVAQSIFWIIVSVSFAGLIYARDGHENAWQFLTAYVTEYSLSVDNIFVFIMVFRHFKLDEKFHHKVLYYGIFGAIIFRGIFIGTGHIIVEHFHWVLYIFGAILIYTGFKMLMRKDDDDFDPEKSRVYKFMKKNLRMVHLPDSGKLFTRQNGKFFFTSIFLIIVIVETTDIIFALDSIPAVFSITENTFVIYTSNIFAIMGFRALFFVLEGVIDKFYLLQSGISFILMFIGAKMLLHIPHEMFNMMDISLPDWLSFTVIMVVLGGSILFSLLIPKKEIPEEAEMMEENKDEEEQS